jgi:FixJ family two-component response regulator
MENGQKSTVFVVDDDRSIRKGIARLLRSAGHEVSAFDSAEEFLAGGHSEGPGCLVLDVRLPGVNGLELQDVLVTAERHLPIIFITGLGNIPMSVRAMKAGAVDFLPKPFQDEELLQAVARALAGSQAEQRQRTEFTSIRRRLSTLTAREREVLSHVVAGQLNKQIADRLGIVEKTIKVHRARVMKKMGAASLADLVKTAVAGGVAG